MDHLPLGVAVYDHDLVIQDASRAGAALLGETREGLRGRSLLKHLAGDELADCRRALREPDSSARPRSSVLRAVPVHDDEGGVQGGVAILHPTSGGRPAVRTTAEDPMLLVDDPIAPPHGRRIAAQRLMDEVAGSVAGKRDIAVAWLNLDRFKDVNRALGHEAGDALLRQVGARLREAVRRSDLVAHVGSNDFILVLPKVASHRHLKRLARRMCTAFDQPFVVGSEPVLVTASCGLALHSDVCDSPRDMVDCAHSAMRAAKQLGGDACHTFSVGDLGSPRRLHLLREIQDGIAGGQFTLHYQPQIALGTMRPQAVEALVRWQHPERGLLPPGEFIGFAEETGMIVSLGRHLLDLACRDYAAWLPTLESAPRLAINVSPREFQRADVCGQVRAAARAAGVPVHRLEVEITETAVLSHPAHAAEVVACLHKAGATVALDDFGTGYSSLTHLRELHVDAIKVDRSFVTSCLDDRSAAAILMGLIHIAHDLGIVVVAEGVETQAQLEFVRAVGCDSAQGFHLAKPLPADACAELLRRACVPA
jgi:diguanylate cyclase (GGDEF)-like protein